MHIIALKMLFGDKVKFTTLVCGIAFSVLLITQQGSIFCGLMLRTGSTIFDTGAPIWVSDPGATSLNNPVSLRESELQRVKSIDGVAHASPFLIDSTVAQSDTGATGLVELVGIDDETLMGIPRDLIAGDFKGLNTPDGVFVTNSSWEHFGSPDLGDYFELNEHRVKVVGVLNANKNFTPFPSVYTTYNKALQILPPRSKYLSFILVSPENGINESELCKKIENETELKAFTQKDFFLKTMSYWAKNTGIPINFGITVILGIIIGIAISIQTLYTFMVENMKQFGTFKAIGISNGELAMMIFLQSSFVAVIGYGIGVGLMAIMGLNVPHNGELAFYTPYQILIIAFVLVFFFCTAASLVSIRQVLKIEPAIVFKG
jgi:putative ABC transport system permease protein